MKAIIPRLTISAFFTVLLAVGIGDAILSELNRIPPGTAREINLHRPILTGSELLAGRWTVDLEEWFTNRSWLAHGTAAVYREYAWKIFRRTPANVVHGKNNRLFLGHTLENSTLPYSKKARGLLWVFQKLNQRFNECGARMVVFLVPNAATIFPEETPAWSQKNGRLEFLPELTRLLTENGISAFNATDSLQKAASEGRNVFFRADHHWTDEGANAATAGLANYLSKESPASRLTNTLNPFYDVKWSVQHSEGGSILRKLGLTSGNPVTKSFSDTYEHADFVRKRPAELPSVAWAGTSFSQFHSPNFFANASGLEVEEFSRSAKGSIAKGSIFVAGWTLASLESNPGKGPKMVVLEIPEFNLTDVPGVGGIDAKYRFSEPPWSGGTSAAVKFAATKGLKPVSPSAEHEVTSWVSRGGSAAIEFSVPQPAMGVEISVAIEATPNLIKLSSKPGDGQTILCYDGVGFLNYRFTAKRPATRWKLDIRSLPPGKKIQIRNSISFKL